MPRFNLNTVEGRKKFYEGLKTLMGKTGCHIDLPPEDEYEQFVQNRKELQNKTREYFSTDKKIREKYQGRFNDRYTRACFFFLDPSGTEEADKKNESFIEKVNAEGGKREYYTQFAKELLDVDFRENEVAEKSDHEIIENFLANSNKYNLGWIVDEVLANKEFLDEETINYLNKNRSAYQGGAYRTMLLKYADKDFYPYIPDFDLEDIDKITSNLSLLTDDEEEQKNLKNHLDYYQYSREIIKMARTDEAKAKQSRDLYKDMQYFCSRKDDEIVGQKYGKDFAKRVIDTFCALKPDGSVDMERLDQNMSTYALFNYDLRSNVNREYENVLTELKNELQADAEGEMPKEEELQAIARYITQNYSANYLEFSEFNIDFMDNVIVELDNEEDKTDKTYQGDFTNFHLHIKEELPKKLSKIESEESREAFAKIKNASLSNNQKRFVETKCKAFIEKYKTTQDKLAKERHYQLIENDKKDFHDRKMQYEAEKDRLCCYKIMKNLSDHLKGAHGMLFDPQEYKDFQKVTELEVEKMGRGQEPDWKKIKEQALDYLLFRDEKGYRDREAERAACAIEIINFATHMDNGKSAEGYNLNPVFLNKRESKAEIKEYEEEIKAIGDGYFRGDNWRIGNIVNNERQVLSWSDINKTLDLILEAEDNEKFKANHDVSPVYSFAEKLLATNSKGEADRKSLDWCLEQLSERRFQHRIALSKRVQEQKNNLLEKFPDIFENNEELLDETVQYIVFAGTKEGLLDKNYNEIDNEIPLHRNSNSKIKVDSEYVDLSAYILNTLEKMDKDREDGLSEKDKKSLNESLKVLDKEVSKQTRDLLQGKLKSYVDKLEADAKRTVHDNSVKCELDNSSLIYKMEYIEIDTKLDIREDIYYSGMEILNIDSAVHKNSKEFKELAAAIKDGAKKAVLYPVNSPEVLTSRERVEKAAVDYLKDKWKDRSTELGQKRYDKAMELLDSLDKTKANLIKNYHKMKKEPAREKLTFNDFLKAEGYDKHMNKTSAVKTDKTKTKGKEL